jgi:hypothetical protein
VLQIINSALGSKLDANSAFLAALITVSFGLLEQQYPPTGVEVERTGVRKLVPTSFTHSCFLILAG